MQGRNGVEDLSSRYCLLFLKSRRWKVLFDSTGYYLNRPIVSDRDIDREMSPKHSKFKDTLPLQQKTVDDHSSWEARLVFGH